MGMEAYGDDYRGAPEPIFCGIPTFLKLPLLKKSARIREVKA